MSPMSISSYCRTTSELLPEQLQQVALRVDTKFWREPTWDHCCHGWITSTARKTSIYPSYNITASDKLNHILVERRKKNGTEALSHPAVNWSQTCDLASLLFCAAATSLHKELQPGPPPLQENRRCLNGRAQNGFRQLSTSLSLLEMHRDMT